MAYVERVESSGRFETDKQTCVHGNESFLSIVDVHVVGVHGYIGKGRQTGYIGLVSNIPKRLELEIDLLIQ